MSAPGDPNSLAFYETRLRALADQLAGRGPFSVAEGRTPASLPRRVERTLHARRADRIDRTTLSSNNAADHLNMMTPRIRPGLVAPWVFPRDRNGQQLAESCPSAGAESMPTTRLRDRRLGCHLPYKSPVELRATCMPDAGCRLGSLRASPKLIPEDGSAPGFDIV